MNIYKLSRRVKPQKKKKNATIVRTETSVKTQSPPLSETIDNSNHNSPKKLVLETFKFMTNTQKINLPR